MPNSIGCFSYRRRDRPNLTKPTAPSQARSRSPYLSPLKGGEGLLPPTISLLQSRSAHCNHELSGLLPMAAPAANLQAISLLWIVDAIRSRRRSCRAALLERPPAHLPCDFGESPSVIGISSVQRARAIPAAVLDRENNEVRIRQLFGRRGRNNAITLRPWVTPLFSHSARGWGAMSSRGALENTQLWRITARHDCDLGARDHDANDPIGGGCSRSGRGPIGGRVRRGRAESA